MWFILAMGFSLMPTPASVFAVRHKELSMLIHSILTSLKTNQHEWQQLHAYPPNVFLSDTHTPWARTDRLLLFTWVSVPRESLLWELFLYAASLSLTCSYLPAAGERLSRSLAGFSSDTSTANCQTGFLGVDADKSFCLLRQSRPENVWLWSESGFVML